MVAARKSWNALLLVVSVVSKVYGVPVDDLSLVGAQHYDTTGAVDLGRDHRSEAHQVASVTIGGPHGEAWSDQAFIERGRHRRIAAIKMWCGERLSGIQFAYADLEPNNFKPVLEWGPLHGAETGFSRTLPLSYYDYILGISISVVQHKRGLFSRPHSRIGYIGFDTKNSAASITCGRYDGNVQDFTIDFSKYTLLYMSGTAGAEVDSLQGHFIPLADYSRYGPQN